MGNFAHVAPINETSKSFEIISSEYQNGTPMGKEQKVSWMVFGRDKNLEIQIWRRLLVQAKETYINNQANLSYLLSVFSFESFIDTVLAILLKNKDLHSEAIDNILIDVHINSKIHSMLKSLDNIEFKKSRGINKNYQKIISNRNKIAHGRKIEITNEDAKFAFETVVRGIYYILERTSIFNES